MDPPGSDPDWLPGELPTSGSGIDAPDATAWFQQTMVMTDVIPDLSSYLLEPFLMPVHDFGRTSSELKPGPNHSFRRVRDDDPWNPHGLEESHSGSASAPASAPVSFADAGRRPQSTSVAQRPRDVPPSDVQSMATSPSAFASRPPQTYSVVSTNVAGHEPDLGKCQVPRALQHAPVSDSALLSSPHPRRLLPPRSRQRRRQSPLSATLPFVCESHACSLAFRTKCELTKHCLGHKKAHRCGMVGCQALAGFRTANDLIRHRKSRHQIHGPGGAYYRCAAAQCRDSSKQWPRLDNFRNHVRKRHPDENLEETIASSKRYEGSGAANADLRMTGAGLAPNLARHHSHLSSIDSRTGASSALTSSYVFLPSARSEATGPVDDVSAPWGLPSHAAIHHASASGRLSVRALRPGRLSGQALDQATMEAVRVESGPAKEREMAPSDLARPATTLPSTPGDVRVDEDRRVHPPDPTMPDVLNPMPADIEHAGGPTARAPLDVSSLVQRLAQEAVVQLLTAVVHRDRHQAPSVAGSVECSEPWSSDRPRPGGFSDDVPAGRRPLDRSAPPSARSPGLSIDLDSADGLRGRRAWTPCTPHERTDHRLPLRARQETWKSGRSAAAAREPTLSAPRGAMSAAPRPARTRVDHAATSEVDASQFDVICAAGTWVISTTRHATRHSCRIGPSPLGTSPGPAVTFPAAPSRSEPKRAEPKRAEARHREPHPCTDDRSTRGTTWSWIPA
ncbi:MAG: hypothetical protein M1826_007426 [Phylliscum demangeonii]|nr:MAG: hypothetical protein M1826_007426 [Phylliscum demangeonii]